MAISFQCKISGLHDPTKHFVVSKTLEGLKRTAKPKRTRLPITVDMLKGILTKLPALCFDEYETTLFSCAFTFAFFGFFRVGEITADSNKDPGSKIVNMHDLSWGEMGKALLVRLRYSKTDQLGEGTTIKLLKQSHTPVCPVRATERYLSFRQPSSGPLFRHGTGRPLTRYQFSAVLRKALCMLDPNFAHYTSHSFRLGAASSAAKWGWPAEKIKESGRWLSDAYKGYVHDI